MKAAIWVVVAMIIVGGLGFGLYSLTRETQEIQGNTKFNLTDTTIREKRNIVIEAYVGEIFYMELASNPTTGYDWTIKPESAIQYLGYDTTGRGAGIGAPSTRIYKFKALEQGETKLILLYEQSIERGFRVGDVAKTIEITVKVLPAGTPSPKSGALREKEILIIDAKQPVRNEDEAASLARAQLKAINAADLIRIQGPITETTLQKIQAQDFKRNNEEAFLVDIEYSVGADRGKLAVTITKDGKIFGYMRDQ
jgi:predicted secreted protein